MKKLYILLFTFLIAISSIGQTTVFQESFETYTNGTVYTTSIVEFSDGFGDFFGRTNLNDTAEDANDLLVGTFYTLSGTDGDFCFAAMDLDAANPTGSGGSPTQTLFFDDINISSYSNLTLAILLAEDQPSDSNFDWDGGDLFYIEVDYDNSGIFTKVLQFATTATTGSNISAPMLDTDIDGIGDGTALTGAFAEFSVALGTGNLVDVRLVFENLGAGDEDISVDNIRIVDGFVAEPTLSVADGPANGSSIDIPAFEASGDITFTTTNFNVDIDPNGDGYISFTVTDDNTMAIINNVDVFDTSTPANYGPLTPGETYSFVAELLNYDGTSLSPVVVWDVTVTVLLPPTNNLVLTGIFDGPLTNGLPKGIELYSKADIPDLSKFGVSSVSNGGGSSAGTIEYTFPADAVSAGTHIWLATESTGFTSFFGVGPTYTSGVVGINGDDSIELYENGEIIDTFGDVNMDGSGEPWDYLDGWAYRLSSTGPDGTFVLANWGFSGANALDGETSNATAATPFPAGTYPGYLSVSQIDYNSFSVYPNPTNTGFVNITSTSSDVLNAKVFDILGKEVLEGKVENNQLNVSNLNAGMYILKLSQNNATVTKKLIIQ